MKAFEPMSHKFNTSQHVPLRAKDHPGRVVRVPVIMQMEALECGAACLAMILAYYGRWVSLEEVRRDCRVSRNGSNAGDILRAARADGLMAAGWRYETENLRQEGVFPCIIHWRFNHFVVLRGFRKGRAYLNDPAKGDYYVSMEEFDRDFTGIVLQMEPGENFQQGGRRDSVLSFMRKRISHAGDAVALLSFAAILIAAADVIRMGMSRAFMDQILTGLDAEWVKPFFLIMAVAAGIRTLAGAIQYAVSMRVDGKLASVGSTSFMWHVLRLPMEFFSQRMAGDLQQRQKMNETIASGIVNTVAPLLLNAGMLVFYLIVMVRYSVLLTLIGVGGMAVNLIVGQIVSRKRINITRVMMRDAGNLASSAVSGMEMMETIKAEGAENGFFTKWAGYQAGVNMQKARAQKLEKRYGSIPLLVSSLTSVLVIVIGAYLVIQGEFTVGMVMAFQGFLASFITPAETVIAAGQTIQEMRTSMERVQDVLDYPLDPILEKEEEREKENPEGEKAVSFDKLEGNVELKDVTFGYSRQGQPLIVDFSLKLERGQSVALVGASGCGKSTIAKLISGLYAPWSGEILFGGKKMEEIDRAVFTGSVAVADQEIILFEDTIANNIRMWDSTIEDFEMIMAARDARIHEDIMQRDGGYQYRIAEGGKDFSGGQRQKLEIARVLAQDPTIVILDEATSALDAETEAEVVRSIKDRGITCIVIAHRLSTVRDCDEIIVLDNGKTRERGTHEKLMARGGLYAQLISAE